MEIAYKFWYIKREDDGYISECTVRFYEGEVVTIEKTDTLGTKKNVEVFRRDARLTKNDISCFSEKKTKQEGDYGETILFTDKDFGKIKTDEELCTFLNKEIEKDTSRTINSFQAITAKT